MGMKDKRPRERKPSWQDWKEAINTLAGFYGDRVIDSR
jgi:hypothetical protein